MTADAFGDLFAPRLTLTLVHRAAAPEVSGRPAQGGGDPGERVVQHDRELVSGSGCSQRSAATRAPRIRRRRAPRARARVGRSVPVRAAIASARGRSIAAMVSRNSACRAGAEVISASVSRSGSPSSEYCSMSAPTTACSSGSSAGRCAQRRGDTRTPFRGERDHDRLLAAGEVVVVGAWGHPGGLGDVVDPNVLRSVFEGQPQRGGAEGFPGGELLALAHAAAVAGAHALQPTEICAHA